MTKKVQMIIEDVNGKIHKSAVGLVSDEKRDQFKNFVSENDVLWFIGKSGNIESFNVRHIVRVTIKETKRFWLF